MTQDDGPGAVRDLSVRMAANDVPLCHNRGRRRPTAAVAAPAFTTSLSQAMRARGRCQRPAREILRTKCQRQQSMPWVATCRGRRHRRRSRRPRRDRVVAVTDRRCQSVLSHQLWSLKLSLWQDGAGCAIGVRKGGLGSAPSARSSCQSGHGRVPVGQDCGSRHDVDWLVPGRGPTTRATVLCQRNRSADGACDLPGSDSRAPPPPCASGSDLRRGAPDLGVVNERDPFQTVGSHALSLDHFDWRGTVTTRRGLRRCTGPGPLCAVVSRCERHDGAL